MGTVGIKRPAEPRPYLPGPFTPKKQEPYKGKLPPDTKEVIADKE